MCDGSFFHKYVITYSDHVISFVQPNEIKMHVEFYIKLCHYSFPVLQVLLFPGNANKVV